ncbi:MAG: crosslink repair DNA glycosylase YcaQ family protein [Candidatus Bathyarchaeia archaeon]
MTLENAIGSKEEALKFINEYGVVTLFPIKGKSFPSLYRVTKGNRREKFDNAWKWADELATDKAIHYGKLVCKQVSLVSLELFPASYRLCRTDVVSDPAKKMLDFIKAHGSTSTTVLRKSLGFWGKGKKYEFAKAMDELQLTFHIAIVGRERAPKMTYTYDLIERWMPETLIDKAEKIDKEEARVKVVAKLMETQAISKPADIGKLLYLSS